MIPNLLTPPFNKEESQLKYMFSLKVTSRHSPRSSPFLLCTNCSRIQDIDFHEPHISHFRKSTHWHTCVMNEIPVTQMRHSREPLFMLPLNGTAIEDLAPSKLPESNILRYSSDSLYLYVATTKLLVECPKLIITVQQQHLGIVGYVSSRVWNYFKRKEPT